jgi:hypothetical protein
VRSRELLRVCDLKRRPMRGIWFGIVLGALMWALIVAVLWLVAW